MGHRPERGALPGFCCGTAATTASPSLHTECGSEHLPRARLVVHDGEGHLGIFEHLGEMLDALTEPDTQDPASTGRA
jgi:hypothetical protein